MKPGDELISVDGAEAWGQLADEMALTNGATAARQRLIASKTMFFGLPGSQLDLRFGRPDGSTYAVTVKRERAGVALPRPARPPVVERVRGGVWYVDLTRLTAQGWSRLQPLLAPAAGVVFDLRGPAGDRPLPAVLGALADRPLRTARFFLPCPERPDQARPPRSHVAYTLPAAPRPLAARLAFLCDARTLGDGEVALALVKDAGLGAIVGEASAGTAGATDVLVLPGGHRVSYTGVAAHEPSGVPLGPVAPTVWVPVTRAGLVAGRDEALERAIALVAGADQPARPRKRSRLAAHDISQP